MRKHLIWFLIPRTKSHSLTVGLWFRIYWQHCSDQLYSLWPKCPTPQASGWNWRTKWWWRKSVSRIAALFTQRTTSVGPSMQAKGSHQGMWRQEAASTWPCHSIKTFKLLITAERIQKNLHRLDPTWYRGMHTLGGCSRREQNKRELQRYIQPRTSCANISLHWWGVPQHSYGSFVDPAFLLIRNFKN